MQKMVSRNFFNYITIRTLVVQLSQLSESFCAQLQILALDAIFLINKSVNDETDLSTYIKLA